MSTTKINGSGLGLILAREIVEAHTGDLAFSSRPGEGTTVTVSFPMTTVATPPAITPQEKLAHDS
jgi:signal transduction histidine kinase